MNKIKKRHKFRPIAPAILEEHAQDYFDMPKESRYMSYVYKCKKPKEIPAALHVDNTARVQTVPKDSPSVLRPILERWYEKTGCPVIVNTSFNVRGEPIVNTPIDAFNCFMGTELDYLVIGDCILDKSKQDPNLKKDYTKKFKLD